MKTLILLRGPMGVGKTTYVKEMGLEPYTLSPDIVRTVFASPKMTLDGFKMNGSLESQVWAVVMQALEERMKRGAFTVVDATHVKQSAISAYRALCQKYGYRCYVVEFDKDLETVLEQNEHREHYKIVPEQSVINAHTRFTTESVPGWVTRIGPSRDDFNKHILWRPVNMDKYNKVAIIGDIHGCYEVMTQMLQTIGGNQYGLPEDTLYVFTGDYIDRGLRNGDVMTFLFNIMHLPNVILLEGNHENHLRTWGYGDEIRSRAFREYTLPQLKEVGFTEKMARQFVRKLQQMLMFDFRGQRYLVTHGGITNPEGNLVFYSTEDLIKGVGGYEANIDGIFDSQMKTLPKDKRMIQVHGHRNMYRLRPLDYPYSINLEGQVEHGGALRGLVIDDNGDIETIALDNQHYKPHQREEINLPDTVTIEEFVREARTHKYIKEGELPSGISSFNFTRKAFDRRAWDTMTTKARGLFINTEVDKPYISARAYDKFFNDGEREETRPNRLIEDLKFPIDVYHKENGYLGLMSHDTASGELKFYSKSTSSDTDSKHARWLKEYMLSNYSPETLSYINRFSKTNNVTLVFEIVLMDKDPHIIKYDGNHVYLLDIIYNQLKFKKAPYTVLEFVAKNTGIECKRKYATFTSWRDYFLWYNDVIHDYSIQEEGYVVEDSNGFMFKIKAPYYSSWKKMRGLLDKVRKNQTSTVDHRMLFRPEENEFYRWIKDYENKDELITPNLIMLRDKFLAEKQASIKGENKTNE